MILVPTWFYLEYAQHSYLSRPHTPQPEMGWTTPLPTKGGTVYVTAGEKATLTWLLRIDLALFGVARGLHVFRLRPAQSAQILIRF